MRRRLGGIIGAFIGNSLPEKETHYYEDHIKKGWILLTVLTINEELAYTAKKVLEENDAKNISITTKMSLLTHPSDAKNKEIM